MTTKDVIKNTNDSIRLLQIYNNSKGINYIRERQMIIAKIYKLEIPDIKQKLSKISDINDLIFRYEDSYSYTDIFCHLFTSKKPLKTMEKRLNLNSFYNYSRREHYRKLYFLLTEEKVSNIRVQKLINKMTVRELEHFGRITGVNLSIFIHLKKMH